MGLSNYQQMSCGLTLNIKLGESLFSTTTAKFTIHKERSYLTPRAADAAAPRANVAGFSAQHHTPTKAMDGDAAPLTLSLGMALQTVVMLVVDVGGATRGLSLVLKFRHDQRECQHLV